ncbi:MAG: threonine/serine exporter family protein [Fusobacteriaceae bacterium]
MTAVFLKSIMAIIATLCFGIIFNVRGRKHFYSGLGGGIAWFVFDSLKFAKLQEVACYFIASMVLSIYCEFMAKKLKSTVTVFLVPALIPIVPGGGVFYTLFYIVQKNNVAFMEKGIETFLFAGALTFGILVVSTMSDVIYKIKKLI